MQFLRVDDNGKYHVDEKAAAFISGLNEVAVVSVVGRYRSGKSYILNRLVGKSDMFKTSATVNAMTRGLYVSDELVGKGVLLMDSEGLGNTEVDQTHDTNIFALAMLMSSRVLFNNMGPITSQALSDLQLASNISNMIAKTAPQFATAKPSLKWLLRDFSLKMETREGTPLTANEYVKYSIDKTSPELASSLEKLFRSQTGCVFPRPTTDDSNNEHMTNLTPAFQSAVRDLIDDVHNHTDIKKFGNINMTGTMMVNMARTFCATINGGNGIPKLKSVWESVVEASIASAMQKTRDHIRDQLALMIHLSEDDLQSKTVSLLQTSLQTFSDSYLGELTIIHAKSVLESAFIDITSAISCKKVTAQQQQLDMLSSSSDIINIDISKFDIFVGKLVAVFIGSDGVLANMQLSLNECKDDLKTAQAATRDRDEKLAKMTTDIGELESIQQMALQKMKMDIDDERFARDKLLQDMELQKQTHDESHRQLQIDHEDAVKQLEAAIAKIADATGLRLQTNEDLVEATMKIDRLQQTVDALQSDMGIMETSMKKTQKTLMKQTTDIKNHTLEMNQSNTQLAEATTCLDKHKKMVTMLQQEQTTSNNEHQSDINRFKQELSKVQITATMTSQTLSDERKRAEKRRRVDDGANASITTLSTENKFLNERYTQHKDQVRQLQQDATTAQNRIRSLELQLLMQQHQQQA